MIFYWLFWLLPLSGGFGSVEQEETEVEKEEEEKEEEGKAWGIKEEIKWFEIIEAQGEGGKVETSK